MQNDSSYRSDSPAPGEKLIFRSVAFPLSGFDYLKQFQRDHAARTGEHLNNNRALALILKQHQQLASKQQQNAAREGRIHVGTDRT